MTAMLAAFAVLPLFLTIKTNIMAFTGAYTVSQGSDPSSFTITDTSVGSDPAITDRRISLFKDNGTTLVPEGSSTTYIDWPLLDGNTKVISLLTQDTALRIEVQWISSSPLPPPSSYSATNLYGFLAYSKNFDAYAQQLMITNPLLVSNRNFIYSRMKLRVFIDSAETSIAPMNDIVSAQLDMNLATELTNNFNYNFQ